MKKYYLSIDFGASGACCILGHLKGDALVTEEIFRFETGFIDNGENKVWNLNLFLKNILSSMRKCYVEGKIPSYVGIDTWGVDFVLLDENDNPIGDAVSYRDSRTEGMPTKVEEIIPFSYLYERTGIQKQKFNTIYQLMALKEQNEEVLKEAKTFLMLPDYFNFLLTGKKHQEYTNATTTGLINARSKNWDYEIIERLGLPGEIFLPVETPGKIIGPVTKVISDIIGYSPNVVMVAGHDTASAIMAVPVCEENSLYISSGTWSLIGTETSEPICSEQSRLQNFTNEGGFSYRFRYLKNIMGLWMIQSIKKEIAPELSYGDIASLAESSKLKTIIDVNDECFLAPASMKDAIDDYCTSNGLAKPDSIGDYAKLIYDSLAVCYKKAVNGIEKITGQTFDAIHIIGGGSNADYLNRVTSKVTGKTVIAGPAEGTALGNLSAMLIATGDCNDLKQTRKLVKQSSLIHTYKEN